MKTYQWTCCERVAAPDQPDYNGEIIVIEGLVTPPTSAETRGEALAALREWFIANKCRPYMEV